MERKHIVIAITTMLFIFIIVGYIKNLNLFIVDSGSMQPTLEIGELIVVKEKEQYEVEDIITYYDKKFGGYITHRIIEVTEDGKFITKGDFNNVCDEKMVDTKEIIGRVIFHSKILGLLFYQYKVVTILIVMVGLILVNLY